MRANKVKKQIQLFEAKPNSDIPGWYFVTLYSPTAKNRSNKYSREWVQFDGINWLYEELKGKLVCHINKKA